MSSVVTVKTPNIVTKVQQNKSTVTKVRYGVDSGYRSYQPDAALITQIAQSLGVDESTIKACKVQILSN